MIKRETTPNRLTDTAIASQYFSDAMMVSLARVIRVAHEGTYQNDNPLDADLSSYEFTKKLVEHSDGKCGIATLLTIEYLHKNSPQLFDYLIGLESRIGPFVVPSWHYHKLALAKIKGTEKWLAGSAANYSRNQDNNMAVKLYSGALEDVLDQIEEDSGGVWPTQNKVRECLAEYKAPKYRETFPIPRLYMTSIITDYLEEKRMGSRSSIQSIDMYPVYELSAVHDYNRQFSQDGYRRRLRIIQIASKIGADI